MLNIHYVNGSQDSTLAIDPAILSKSLADFKADTVVTGLTAGKLATIGANGYVTLADHDAFGAGFIINDVAGELYENVPAYASGVVPVVNGGGLVTTDALKEDTIAPADVLYIGTGADVGTLTNVRPVELTLTTGTPDTINTYPSNPFGLARNANSANDKSVMVQF